MMALACTRFVAQPIKAAAPLQQQRPRRCVRVLALKENEDKPLGSKQFKNQPAGLAPSFTREREHLTGRIASLGMAAALIGETLTGAGPVSQLHFETGLDFKWLYITLFSIVGYCFFGSINTGKPQDTDDNINVKRRAPVVNPLEDPAKSANQNELAIGRIAMLLFPSAAILEYIWGGEGPLVHLGLINAPTSLFGAPWYIYILIATFAATGLGLFSGGKNRFE